jgi:hypothetical protein|tara:strand:+ start:89 stop:541 length:453 start_codon:yes stop_codon:yes gene_type:complete
MKLDQLRKIIREEVRSAVKEELQDVMNEAVKAASAPNTMAAPAKTIQVEAQTPTNPGKGKASLDEMLQMTKNNMTNEEYKTIFSGNANNAMGGVPQVNGTPRQKVANSLANQMQMNTGAGIDISQLDFVKKAGAVLQASELKDKQKAGTV